MPYKSEKIPLPSDLDRRRKLTDEDRQEIRKLYGKLSQRKLALMFGVSRRTIQFVGDPKKLEENLKRREERGGWRVYYDRQKNTDAVRDTRRYKQKLYTKGEL